MPHVLARKTPPSHRLILALTCALGLMTGPICATAATRHGAHSTAKDSATPVWRCTDAHGGTRYSQQPCEGGTALTHLSDPRTAAQREQVADMLERDDKLLRRLGRERHHQEVLARDQGHGSLSPKRTRHAATVTPAAHAPVPLQRCRPPNCFTARLPKDKNKSSGKAASPAAPSASS
jgi:hypothetical protein